MLYKIQLGDKWQLETSSARSRKQPLLHYFTTGDVFNVSKPNQRPRNHVAWGGIL